MKNFYFLSFVLTLLGASSCHAAEAPPAKRLKPFDASPAHATQYSSLDSVSQLMSSLESSQATTAPINWLQEMPAEVLIKIMQDIAGSTPEKTAQTLCRIARTNKAFHGMLNHPATMLSLLDSCPRNQDKKRFYALLARSNFSSTLEDAAIQNWFKRVQRIHQLSQRLYDETAAGNLAEMQTIITHAQASKISIDFHAMYLYGTAVMNASYRGNIQALQLLIAAGADLNCKNQNDETALTEAIRFQQPHAVQLLLSHGAKLTNETRLLKWASATQDSQILESLLAAGLDPRAGSHARKNHRARQNALEEATINNQIILAEAIKKAQEKSQEKSRAKALRPRLHLQSLPERIKQPLFECLAAKNPAKIAQRFFTIAMADPEFLADMQDPAYLKTFFKALPFKQNRVELANYFLDCKGMANAGKTPFFPGFTHNQIEEFKKEKFGYAFDRLASWLNKTRDHLEENAPQPVIGTDHNGLVCIQGLSDNRYININHESCIKFLARAIETRNKRVAMALLCAGVNPDSLGTELLYAGCNPEMIQLLLDFGANPSIMLFAAAHSADVTLSKLLIAAGGHMQHDGRTLLMQGAQEGNVRLIETLLAAGADPQERNPHDGNRTASDYIRPSKKRGDDSDQKIRDLLNGKIKNKGKSEKL